MFVDRKNVICDPSLDTSTAASKPGILARSSRVSETGGPKNRSLAKDGHSTKSLDSRGNQVAVGGLHSKASASKSRYAQDNLEILTTDKLYYSSATIRASQHELMDGTEVLGKMIFHIFQF